MKTEIEKYKGIHPGLILEHELKKRKIAKNQFASAIDQHRQTLNAITKGRRNYLSNYHSRSTRNWDIQRGLC